MRKRLHGDTCLPVLAKRGQDVCGILEHSALIYLAHPAAILDKWIEYL
jgi:hypothetical protein